MSRTTTGSRSDGDGGFPRPPLPRGRHRLTPEEVAENQRDRLFEAVAESIAARGYAATSVERIIEFAGVSRGTFYEHFANRRECLLAAYETIFERFVGEVSSACAAEERWLDKASMGIAAAIGFAERSPRQTRLLTLDSIAADRDMARRALAGWDRVAAMLRSGRQRHPKAASLPESTERALVGAVASAINWRLLSGEPLDDLEPQLVQLVLTPYLGPAAAMRQAAKVGRGSLGGEVPAVET